MRSKKPVFLWACLALTAILTFATPATTAETAETGTPLGTAPQRGQRLSALSDTLEAMDRLQATLRQKEAALELLLNIGTVREGERLIYDGIPWRVGALNLQTMLTNSELSGGVPRLPLASLIGRQSRPYDREEPWFPTRTGDYVTLADGTFGKVILQTPETVTLDVLGGCRKTYPAASFMGQNPVNLSRNNFGVGMTFGVDYDHQADVTRDIPERLRAAIMADMRKEEFGADLIDVLVQFKEAAASSLDLFTWASFSGNAAPYYYAIGRVLQRIAVDACNTNGWGIPFTQITVHQAQAEGGVQGRLSV